MSDDIFSALFGVFGEQTTVKFYAFLDERDNLIATGTQTDLAYSQQCEIDENSHKLCLDKGVDLLRYESGKLVVKDFDVVSKELVYIGYKNEQSSVLIKVSGTTASAKITKKGLVELENFSSRGKLTSKIWLLDANARHRCIAELKIGSDFIMDSVKLEYIPKRIIAATYPIFTNYSFETE